MSFTVGGSLVIFEIANVNKGEPTLSMRYPISDLPFDLDLNQLPVVTDRPSIRMLHLVFSDDPVLHPLWCHLSMPVGNLESVKHWHLLIALGFFLSGKEAQGHDVALLLKSLFLSVINDQVCQVLELMVKG